MSAPNPTAAPTPIGAVLGTEESTPVSFWVAVSPEARVQLDDLVTVRTALPGGGEVAFYGMVDTVRKVHEGLKFESDTADVVAGLMPATTAYAARILVTRVYPEIFVPPQPGDPVRHARGRDLELALSADKMERSFPGGLLADGQPMPLNFDFINGQRGGHINISGISGIATKTSYALFLLHSMFNSGLTGPADRAIIFNVKGEDLLHLDKPNRDLNAKEGAHAAERGRTQDRYALLGLPARPFGAVQFLTPPAAAGGDLVPGTGSRSEGLTAFVFTLREFCSQRMLPFAFSDGHESMNLGFVIDGVEERLHRLAQDGSGPYLSVSDWQPEGGEGLPPELGFDALGKVQLRTFGELVDYIDHKLTGQNDGEGDPKWTAKQHVGTLRAFVRRLRGVQRDLAPLVRGDITPEQAARHRPDLLAEGKRLSVVDIHRLSGRAQMFVVGVLLRDVFALRERQGGGRATTFVVLDELNKYAPREGSSPIKDVLLDIAERGRSLGVILIGAQQTASEVERRIVSNAAVRVVGRLDMAEAERPEYRFLPQSFRQRAGILQPGSMMVSQPDVPNPVLVSYPFPAWATRASEVAHEDLDTAALLDGLGLN